jgi:UDP-glucuronate decarboxylase
MVGGDARIEYRPLPEDDPVQRQPAIEKAERVLDWRPKVDLDAGLAATIEYFRGTLAR